MLNEKHSQTAPVKGPAYPVAATTLVVLPVFNEVCFLDEILRQVFSYAKNVLVIDDGSNDGTSAGLKRYSEIKVISHQRNMGYGRSLIDGFDFAAANQFEWLITLDADHQHEPACIPRFYAEIHKNDADIISGSRYITANGSSATCPPADRVAINRQITGILNRALKWTLTDAFCGFKAYRVEAISGLGLTEEGYGLPLQLWVRAAGAGLAVREIHVPMIYHDSKRNFAGKLENPDYRLNYYCEILKRELVLNGFHQV